MGPRAVLLVVVVVLAGCGRLGFGADLDARPGEGDAGGGDDAPVPDAPEGVCPPGYVFVGGAAALGTTDFCVMTFEAKAEDLATGEIAVTGCDSACAPNGLVATHKAAAVPEGEPWVRLDTVNARAMCQAHGTGFDLMSNREWMTIARDAEAVGANWSGGAAGRGMVVQGHTDGSGGGAVTDPGDPYSDTGNSAADPPGAGWEQRRTIVLGNGTWIWDMPGNVQEWIDWTLGDPLDGAPTPCSNAELPAFACTGIVADDFDSSTGTYDSSNGVGTVIGGDGDATRRGGQRGDLSLGIAGIYALNMNRFTDDTFPATGFRCVFRL
jgi:hypothetical protein